ncbi:hypothetical protein E2C01_102239 [Portunus trituberculatus]|uniref:Uncharacterized protein n=1 Tax=Portunus trituberculatus TaxID=210409 RepID=A0A5B7KNR2_PORTR|nr:hypothetical protein [Portunus trituberculatus]
MSGAWIQVVHGSISACWCP